MKSVIQILKKIVLYPRFLLIKTKLRAENCVCLLGTSTYNNLGDHLLSQNSFDFLKKTFPNRIVIEIPTQIYKRYEKQLANIISRQTIICISAGGWMGNLWPEDELMMQRMLESFSNNKIYILPQTVYYDKSIHNFKNILQKANLTYEKCADLTLFVREKNSYNTALTLLNIRQILLAPDMGLYGKKKNSNSNNNGKLALLCFRDDRESSLKNNEENKIHSILRSKGYSIDKFNTITKHNISISKRLLQLTTLKNKLSTSNIVFTDRLHGMILAATCGCKCIVFDNNNHKISGVYNTWLKNNPNILMIDEHFTFNETIFDNFMHNKFECSSIKNWINSLDSEFNNMSLFMREKI